MDRPTNVDLASLAALVRARRTNLRMDPLRPVPPQLVEELCALATWAPNHKRTWPWRFAALTGDARARLGEVLAEALIAEGAPAAKVDKARGKYLRAPLMLAVACCGLPEAEGERAAEDRDAVAAGVQNVLLGATAAGLASYWGTGQVATLRGVKELCRFDPDDVIVALVYLGWPTGDVPAPERPTPTVHHVQ